MSYSNLHPGKYLFLVKGSNNDGLWNETPARLKITISPPWWKTMWAYISYFIVFSLLLYAFITLIMIRAKQAHSLKIERMEREKDEELSEQKMQFFTNISHEFRTPLSLILSPLENVISSVEPKSELKNQLLVIKRNADRLFRLVNELMDLRKIDDQKLRLKVQQGDIIKFISDLSGYFSEIILQKKIRYQFVSVPESYQGWYDQEKLEKILFNLISNALKFVPENGRVSVQIEIIQPDQSVFHTFDHENVLSTTPSLLCVKISNNGTGIASFDLPFVFKRFCQGRNAENKEHTGSGIGLALAKSLAELHHGNIYVESQPDEETIFTLCIPVDREEYNSDEIDINPIDITDVDIHGYYDGILYDKSGNTGGLKSEGSEILLVEDNDDLRNYLVGELGKTFRIIEARDGDEGIKKAFQYMPDLIISDILMPVMSGTELCKTIKNDLRTSHIPLILLTAKTSVENQIEGIEAGADIYITKPFNMGYLLTQIKHIIETRIKLYAKFSQEVHLMPAKLANNMIDEAFLLSITDYIVKNLSNTQLGVESLAAFSKLSRSQVYRKIRALTGKSAVEFIRIVRLKQAIKLMGTKKYSLSEIAFETGFNSPSYFTRSFKKQYGKAPSEYIDNQK